MRVTKPYDPDFLAFCQNATDVQLIHILRKEWNAWKGWRNGWRKGTGAGDPEREASYRAALLEAYNRGWYVRAGEVG